MVKILRAAAAVAALAAMVAALLFWTRDSPYRGRLVADSPQVEVERGQEKESLRTLLVEEIRAGDIIRTGPEGAARLDWAAGGRLRILGSTEVVITGEKAGFELRSGRVRVLGDGRHPVSALLRGRRYLIRAVEADLTPERVEAVRGELEITPENAPPVRIGQGGSAPWP